MGRVGWIVAVAALGLVVSSCDVDDRATGGVRTTTTSRPGTTTTMDPVLGAIADGYVARC
jgi:hypothetical protein